MKIQERATGGRTPRTARRSLNCIGELRKKQVLFGLHVVDKKATG